jgi:hypothetical protein
VIDTSPGVLEQLLALLPAHLVRIRKGTTTAPHTRPMAEGILADALDRGYLIDRSNGEGPLEEWDGWLVIDTPGQPTYLLTEER